jgi:hypothetical protein
LKWVTTNETPGIQYEVQHSSDGINFTVIKTIPSQNSARSEYDWLHASPAKGKNYYRIRAVENDKDAFTVTRMLSFSNAETISLYPNPTQSGATITIRSSGNTMMQVNSVEILDINGRPVATIPVVTGGPVMMITLPVIPSGRYILKGMNGENCLFSAGLVLVN